jgi:hypothetical protein
VPARLRMERDILNKSNAIFAGTRVRSNAACSPRFRQIHRDGGQRIAVPAFMLSCEDRDAASGRPCQEIDATARYSRHQAPSRRVQTIDSRHDLPIAPNRMQRDAITCTPNSPHPH